MPYFLVLLLSLTFSTHVLAQGQGNDFAHYLDLSGKQWVFKEVISQGQHQSIEVPSSLREQGLLSFDSLGIYQLDFFVDQAMSESPYELALVLGRVEEADQVWLNHQVLGATGTISYDERYPVFSMGSYRVYPIAPGRLTAGENHLRVMVQTYLMGGGIRGPIVAIMPLASALDLQKRSEQRTILGQMLLVAVMLATAFIALLMTMFVRHLAPEHHYFFMVFVFSAFSYGVDTLAFYQTGLKTPLLQWLGWAMAPLISASVYGYALYSLGRQSVKEMVWVWASSLCFTLLIALPLDIATKSYVSLLWVLQVALLLLRVCVFFFHSSERTRLYPLVIGLISYGVMTLTIMLTNSDVSFVLRLDEWAVLIFMISLVFNYIYQLVSMKAQVHDLLLRLFNSAETERNFLARELHDGINQRLAAMRIRLNMLENTAHHEQIQRLDNDLALTLEEADRLVHNLRPLWLEKNGLAGAIEQEANAWMESAGVAITLDLNGCHYDAKGIPTSPLNENTERHLLRIYQESIHNAIKHAKADEISVSLKYEQKSLVLQISNNGQRLSTNLPKERDHTHQQGDQQTSGKRRFGGFGRISMQERVTLINGSLLFTSTPAGHTIVRVTVPMDKHRE